MTLSVIGYKLTIFSALASKGRGMRPAMLEKVSSILYATFTNHQSPKGKEAREAVLGA